MTPVMDRLSEFFLLRDLEKTAREVPAEQRAAVVVAHQRARQKRVAAETLWISGSPAEALRLAREGAEILRGLQRSEPVASESAPLPELDADVTPAHADRYHALLAEIDRLADDQLGAVLNERGVRTLRITRIAVAASVALASLLLLWALVRTPKTLKAEASAQYDAAHDPSRAVDGSDKTEWLLPDKATGWLEVQVVPARNVKRLKVLNARNPPWNDRATQDFHVDVYFKGQVVKQFDHRFESFNPDPTWRNFDVGTKVDRVRLTVKSHHASGAGFGEVEVE